MIDFLVHTKNDDVGVVVVEGETVGRELRGEIMETGERITVTCADEIPLGHKVSLRKIPNGGTVTEYGHDIGRAVAAIDKGNYVHVHNIKTKRW